MPMLPLSSCMWCCWKTSRTRPWPLRTNSSPSGDRGDAGRVLTAMLQHRQGVIDPLIDSAGSDDSGDAAHSVQFLRLETEGLGRSSRSSCSPTMPRRASGDSDGVRHEPRILPARVFVHAQRLHGDGECADDDDAADDAEDEPQELVHAGEHGDANVMSKYHAHRAAQQEHADEDDDARRPDAARRTDQHAAQDGLERGREIQASTMARNQVMTAMASRSRPLTRPMTAEIMRMARMM